MDSSRSAVDTINGYFYQFDYSILSILNASDGDDSICVEGIEDVDKRSGNDTTAVQCKYYAKTEYNHSVIAKPIRLMLDDFANRLRSGEKKIDYYLYGHYKSGQEKLPESITVDFLKTKFLTYTKDGVNNLHHDELSLNNDELGVFLDCLTIDVYAKDYHGQRYDVQKGLQQVIGANLDEVTNLYYPNAISVISELAMKQDVNDRRITKGEFLDRIKVKDMLFNSWMIEFEGMEKYCKRVKRQYFSSTNISPFDRFFVLDITELNYTVMELKTLIMSIAKKYSKIGKRVQEKFCPYVCVIGLLDDELLSLKDMMFREGVLFEDGYYYHGAEFAVDRILQPPTQNGTQVKLLCNGDDLLSTINSSKRTIEIFHFYFNCVQQLNCETRGYYIQIQVKEISNIQNII